MTLLVQTKPTRTRWLQYHSRCRRVAPGSRQVASVSMTRRSLLTSPPVADDLLCHVGFQTRLPFLCTDIFLALFYLRQSIKLPRLLCQCHAEYRQRLRKFNPPIAIVSLITYVASGGGAGLHSAAVWFCGTIETRFQ